MLVELDKVRERLRARFNLHATLSSFVDEALDDLERECAEQSAPDVRHSGDMHAKYEPPAPEPFRVTGFGRYETRDGRVAKVQSEKAGCWYGIIDEQLHSWLENGSWAADNKCRGIIDLIRRLPDEPEEKPVTLRPFTTIEIESRYEDRYLFRHKDRPAWSYPINGLGQQGVLLNHSWLAAEDLLDHYECRAPGATKWQPCGMSVKG